MLQELAETELLDALFGARMHGKNNVHVVSDVSKCLQDAPQLLWRIHVGGAVDRRQYKILVFP